MHNQNNCSFGQWAAATGIVSMVAACGVMTASMIQDYKTNDFINLDIHARNDQVFLGCYNQARTDAKEPCKTVTLADGQKYDLTWQSDKPVKGCITIMATPAGEQKPHSQSFWPLGREGCSPGTAYLKHFHGPHATHWVEKITYADKPFEPSVHGTYGRLLLLRRALPMAPRS